MDLDVRLNHAYPQQKQPQKVLEDSRGLHTEAKGEAPPGGTSRPHLLVGQPLGPTCQPPVVMSVLHRLLDCIYAIYSSQFDPRAHVWRSGLYIPAPATPRADASFESESWEARNPNSYVHQEQG